MQTRYGDGRLALTPVGQMIVGGLALLYAGIHLVKSIQYPSLMLVLDVLGVLGGLMFVTTALLGFRDQARRRRRELHAQPTPAAIGEAANEATASPTH